MADQVPESVYSGQAAPDLDGTSYYILLLSGVNSRVMIRRFERGSYADLRRNLRQWYDDLALTNQSGTGNIKPMKLTRTPAAPAEIPEGRHPPAGPGCPRNWPD